MGGSGIRTEGAGAGGGRRSAGRSETHEQEARPGRDDLRGVDDVHRPDDRLDRRSPTIQDDVELSSTGAQWIVNGYLLALAALFAFGGRIADIAGHRRMVLIGIGIFAGASALCGATPDRLDRGGVADLLPRHPGRRCGDHVPGGAGDRRRRLSAGRARQGAGDLLRRRRRDDRARPARRRLPDRHLLAGDLLDQHPGRDRRGAADPAREAGRHGASRAARLPGRRAVRARDGAARARPPAGERLGLGRRRRPGRRSSSVWRSWPRSFVAQLSTAQPADAGSDLREPCVLHRQRDPVPDLDRVRADVPLREHVLADLARRRRVTGRPLHRHRSSSDS